MHTCLSCRTDFTIHGLWPDYNDGSYPSFCTNTKFNPSKVDDLLPELETEWPTFAARGGDAFWKHEYEKHGTCATATFPDEHQYFRGVLDLDVQYNLLVSPHLQALCACSQMAHARSILCVPPNRIM